MKPRSPKKILLVDTDDTRRQTRVRMLKGAGYEVETRDDHEISEFLENEGKFDLLIIALHRRKMDEAAAYSERLRKKKPTLPILLLLDSGVFVPHGTLSETMETGSPTEMMVQIAEKLAGSSHIQELRIAGGAGSDSAERER